jgi:photosystem II stability/assembly factor-like uncharacterized protein
VFVSTHQGLIRIDATGDWWFISEQPHDFMGFAVDPTTPDVVYSSGHPAPGSRLRNPIGFMVSTDAGATWTTRALEGQVDFHAMAVQPTDGQIIYGWDVSNGLHRSTDAGHNWERVPAELLGQAGGALSLAVDPGDAQRILAGTPAGLLESRDGGATWTPLGLVLEGDDAAGHLAIHPTVADTIYVGTYGQDLHRTVDGGSSWEQLARAGQPVSP